MARITAQRSQLATASIWVLVAGVTLATTPVPTDSVMPLRLVALGIGVALGLMASSRGRLPISIAAAILLALTVFTTAALLGDTPLLSLIGRFPRYEGLPVVALYGAAFWVGARILGPDSERTRDTAYTALAVAAMAMATWGVLQEVSTPGQRVPGLLNSAPVSATWGAIPTAMLGWKLLSDRRLLWVVGSLSGAAVVILSGGRGALLGLGLALVVTVFWRLWLRPLHRFWWAAPALCLAAVAGGVYFVATYWNRLSLLQRFTDRDRLDMWSDTWKLALDNPWLGVGPGQFIDSIGAHHSPAYDGSAAGATYWDTPHSGVLQVIASTGFVGLGALLLLIATLAWALLRDRTWDPWRLGATTAMIAVGTSFATSFTDPISAPIVALFVGGAVGLPTARAASTTLERTLGVVAGLLALILGGSLFVSEWLYSNGLYRSADQAATMLHATTVRPWDADLARRVGYSLNALTARGVAEPKVGLALMERTCPSLPGSVECLHVLAESRRLNGDAAGAAQALEDARVLDPHNKLTAELKAALTKKT